MAIIAQVQKRATHTKDATTSRPIHSQRDVAANKNLRPRKQPKAQETGFTSVSTVATVTPLSPPDAQVGSDLAERLLQEELEESLAHLALLERALEGVLADDDPTLLHGLRLLIGRLVETIGEAQDHFRAIDGRLSKLEACLVPARRAKVA